MSPVSFPPRPAIDARCPRCGVQIEGVEHNAGWIQHTMFGTRVGTYPDLPPADIDPSGGMASMESMPDLDRYVLQPCGDMLYPNEAEPIVAALRAAIAEATS